jgi:imidazolonepropionase-like amidohydrolase
MLPTPLQLIAIAHATVFDMTGAPPRRDFTVVADGARIVAVGPSATVRIPSGARVIEGRGKYLIPGLWDMHVHTDLAGIDLSPLLGLYLANGVTGVRDMGGDFARIGAWREEIARGSLAGPRIVASGPYLNGVPVSIPHFDVHTASDAVHAVDSLAAMGVDFVKIHSRVPREAVFAALREAKAKGLAVGGHVSYGVTVEEVSDSGQKSLEHLLGFINMCTPADSTRFAAADPFIRTVFGACTSRDQEPVYRHLARNDTWVTPTLTAAWEFSILPRTAIPADSLAHYIPDSLRGFWRDGMGAPTNLPPSAEALGHELFAKRLGLVAVLHAAGVPILAGTDAPLRNSTPGFGLHEELAFLVQAGFTPMEALRAATYDAARYLGALDSVGTIERGKLADLVLVEGDPTADIRNARRIVVVMTRGRVYDAKARQALFDGAITAAHLSVKPAPPH